MLSTTCPLPEGVNAKFVSSVGLPLCTEIAIGYCLRPLCSSPACESLFLAACEACAVGAQGKAPPYMLFLGNPTPADTYVPFGNHPYQSRSCDLFLTRSLHCALLLYPFAMLSSLVN